jgi:putative Mn2+ efflux pump MntP
MLLMKLRNIRTVQIKTSSLILLILLGGLGCEMLTKPLSPEQKKEMNEREWNLDPKYPNPWKVD